MILYLSATTLQKLQSFRVHQSKRSFERYGHEDMSVRAENTWTFSFLLWHLLRDQARSLWNAGTTSPVISDGDVPSHHTRRSSKGLVSVIKDPRG